jgi:hypothetical protein
LAQVVVNPGFETGSLAGWSVYIPGTGNAVVGSTGHSGSYGLTEGPNSPADIAYQDVYGLTPGQTYVVSVWVEASASNAGTVTLAIHDTQGNGLVQNTLTPATSWQQIAQTYTVTGTGGMRIHLYQNGGSESTYWDDVSLAPVLPLNGGFETASGGPWQGWGIGIGTTSHSGSYGLYEVPNSSDDVAFQDLYGLSPGQTYLVSVWVAASASNAGTVTLAIHDTQGNGLVSTTLTPATSWQQFSQAYTVTGNGSMRIHLYENAGSETTYWDDVTLVPVPPVNPGFETGSLMPWQAGGGGINIATAKIHTGSHSLSEYIGSGSTVAYQDVYGLTPGQSYVVSVWVSASSSTSGQVQLALANNINWAQTVITPGTSWQQISQLFTVGSDGWMRIHLYDLGGPETVYWDDVAVVPVPPVNAGFESGSIAPWQGWGIAIGRIAHSGTYGVTESATNSNDVAFQDVYGVTPGQTYVVSAWVLSSSSSSGQVQLMAHDTQGGGVVANTITPGTSWQQISVSFTADATTAMRIHLWELTGTETTYWDDVTVSGSFSNHLWSNLAPDPQGITGINGLNVWENLGFNSVSPAEPTKEYVRLNGQVIAIENGVKP